MKNIRIKKKKKEEKVVFDQLTQEQRVELDKSIIDIVLALLFNNGGKDELDFRNDVINQSNVVFPAGEVERLWDVLRTTAWVSPLVGFGKAGKLELTNAGYQMMSQYGSYKNYLDAVNGIPQQLVEKPNIQDTAIKPNSDDMTGHEL